MGDTYIVRQGQARRPQQQTFLASGTATIDEGVIFIGGGSATTVTLNDPSEAIDGSELEIVPITAQAHVVDNSAGSGFNGSGSGSDVATFSAALGNSLRLRAYGGNWHVVNNVNATLA